MPNTTMQTKHIRSGYKRCHTCIQNFKPPEKNEKVKAGHECSPITATYSIAQHDLESGNNILMKRQGQG